MHVMYGVILSIIFIISSQIWLQWGLNNHQQRPQTNPWGQIYDRDNQTYIKTNLHTFWQVARIKTLLSSHKTQIQSQDNAFLSILLSNKRGRLEVGENAYLHIHILKNTKREMICEIEITQGDMYISFLGKRKEACFLKWKGHTMAKIQNADMTLDATLPHLQVHVHRGQVTFEEQKGPKGQKKTLSKDMWARVDSEGITSFDNSLSILTPLANDRVAQSQKSRTRFRWVHTTDTQNFKTQLFVGNEKNNLKPVWENALASNEGYFRFPLGTHYWQLVAQPDNTSDQTKAQHYDQIQGQYKSPIYKIFIKPEVRPILISPGLGFTKFTNQGKKERYKFVWLNKSRLENLFIEISNNANFSNLLLKRPVGNFGFIEISEYLPEGKYFWRISGFRHNSSELLTSHVRDFIVVNKNSQFKKIRSWPKNKAKINQWDLQWKEAKIVWDVFSGFQNLRLHVINLNSQFVQTFSIPTNKNRINIPSLDLGSYQWKLQGEQSKNTWIDITETKTLQITSSSVIHWQKAPHRILQWTNGPTPQTSYYVIRIRKYNLSGKARSSQIFVKKVRNNRWVISDEFVDSLSIKIMAMDHQNQVVALSPEKDILFH